MVKKHANGEPEQHSDTMMYSVRPPAGEEEEHVEASYEFERSLNLNIHTQNRL